MRVRLLQLAPQANSWAKRVIVIKTQNITLRMRYQWKNNSACRDRSEQLGVQFKSITIERKFSADSRSSIIAQLITMQ